MVQVIAATHSQKDMKNNINVLLMCFGPLPTIKYSSIVVNFILIGRGQEYVPIGR